MPGKMHQDKHTLLLQYQNLFDVPVYLVLFILFYISPVGGVTNITDTAPQTLVTFNSEDQGLTWGAVLVARQAANLGHDFYQCLYVLKYGAL